MIDENAFGALIQYATIARDEYLLPRAEFVEHFTRFRDVTLAYVREQPPGRPLQATDFGHAIYVEFCEEDRVEDPLVWLRTLRVRLLEAGLESVGVVTHGGRWVLDDERVVHGRVESSGELTLLRVSAPSEPLERALLAAAAACGDDDGDGGWGPGLYLDTEALEALGRSAKNAPTVLAIAGATFYRAGS
ncbi:MAG TPA: hypothetical protein VF989_20490 [Polyangiaceae bacterium]|jgi:hypothetical protein